MNRRLFLASLVSAACARATAAAGTPEPTTIRINIPGPNLISFTPIELIPKLGIDRAAGIRLAIRYLPSGVQALEDMLAGNAHFAGAAFPVLPTFAAKAMPIKAVVALSNGTPSFSVLIRKDLAHQVRSMKDLAGRSVGVPMSSNTTKTYLQVLMEMWLDAYGVKNTQVRWVPIGTNYQGIQGALVGRTVDAVFAEEPMATTLVRTKVGALLSSLSDPKNPTHWVGYRHLRAIIGTTPEVIKTYPQRVTAMQHMAQQALAWMHGRPMSQVFSTLGITDAGILQDMVDTLRRYPDLFSRDGRISDEDIVSTAAFLKTSGLPMPAGLDIRSLILDPGKSLP